jgi:hypothetical protein
MKKFILLLLALVSFQSFAQSIPWPDGQKCGRHVGMNVDGKFLDSYTQYNWYAKAWAEYITDLGNHMGNPNIKMSFEYLQYRAGYQVMKDVEYSPECQQFGELDSETKSLMELQKTRKLTREDFKSKTWIHMVSAIDVEEVNCLALSKKNGKTAGCADVWQDGLSEDEKVCFKGKTYLRCHVECIEKIYNRKVETTSGSCE